MIGNRPKQKSDYYLEALDGEILLYHPSRTTILYLNPTAALVWQLCTGTYTRQEMVALLQNAYPETAEEIPGQVHATLQQFAQQEVIEFV